MKTCKFCQQETQFVPLIDERINETFDIYFCATCNAEYLCIVGESKIWSYSLYTDINEKLYRWTVSGIMGAHVWHIGKPGIPGKIPNKNTKLITTIKQEPLPDVTPQNVNHKLRTWITFL
jgi:hypothetical protein